MSINTIDPTVLEEEDKRDAFEKAFELISEVRALIENNCEPHQIDRFALQLLKLTLPIQSLKESAFEFAAHPLDSEIEVDHLNETLISVISSIHNTVQIVNQGLDRTIKAINWIYKDDATTTYTIESLFKSQLKQIESLGSIHVESLKKSDLTGKIDKIFEGSNKVDNLQVFIEQVNQFTSLVNLKVWLRWISIEFEILEGYPFTIKSLTLPIEGVSNRHVQSMVANAQHSSNHLSDAIEARLDFIFRMWDEYMQEDDGILKAEEPLPVYSRDSIKTGKFSLKKKEVPLVAIWDIKITVYDEYVSGSDFGKLIYLFSSALEAVKDVEVEVVDLGKGSLWVKLVVRVKSLFGQESLKDAFKELLKDFKKAKTGAINKEFGQHTAKTKKVEQETANLKTDQQLKEQGIYSPEQQAKIREFDMEKRKLDLEERKLEIEARKVALREAKAKAEEAEIDTEIKRVALIKRSSEVMQRAIDPHTRLRLEAQGVRLLETYEDDVITVTPEQIEEIAAKGELPAPPEPEE